MECSCELWDCECNTHTQHSAVVRMLDWVLLSPSHSSLEPVLWRKPPRHTLLGYMCRHDLHLAQILELGTSPHFQSCCM